MKRLDNIRYNYHSLSVPGGGFVTGFVFHPNTKNILYARTDIGGIYRFDFDSHKWHSLADRITEFNHYLALPLSVALDDNKPNMLYAMCGNNRKGAPYGKSALIISDNYGESFIEKSVPFCCNGNAPARSSSERLAYKSGILFFGSQGEGLWQSADNGDSWTKTDFCEENIVFVCFPNNQNIMIISCTGETNARENTRGHTLYASYDFVKAVGFGSGNSENEPALFISGRIFGEYGFWKSLDNGESWAKINTDSQMFGNIISMDGDFRKKGRVFIATGTRGGIYGDENIS